MIHCPRCSEIVPMKAILPEKGVLGLLRRMHGSGRFLCPRCETIFKGPTASNRIIESFPSKRRKLEAEREMLRSGFLDQIGTVSVNPSGSPPASEIHCSRDDGDEPHSEPREPRFEERRPPRPSESNGLNGANSTLATSGPLPVSKRPFSPDPPERPVIKDQATAEFDRDVMPSTSMAGHSLKLDDSVDQQLSSSVWRNLLEDLEQPKSQDRVRELDRKSAVSQEIRLQVGSRSRGEGRESERNGSAGERSRMKVVQTIHRRRETVGQNEEPDRPLLRVVDRLG